MLVFGKQDPKTFQDWLPFPLGAARLVLGLFFLFGEVSTSVINVTV